MTYRTILPLGLVTVLALCLAVFILMPAQTIQNAKTGDVLIPGLAANLNDIQKILVEGPEGSSMVSRDAAGVWRLEDKAGYPVQTDVLRTAIVGLSKVRIVDAMTANPDKYNRLSVEDWQDGVSSTRVTLVGPDQRFVVLIGTTLVDAATAPDGEAEFYARMQDAAQSWHVKGPFDVPEKPMDWLDLSVVDEPRSNIKSVVITHADGEVVRVSLPDQTAENFVIENVPDGFMPKTEFVANSVGSSLGWLTVEDVAPLGPVPVDASTTVYTLWDDRMIIIHTFTRDDRQWFAIEKPGDETADMLKDWAYAISDYKATDFAKRMDDLVQTLETTAAE